MFRAARAPRRLLAGVATASLLGGVLIALDGATHAEPTSLVAAHGGGGTGNHGHKPTPTATPVSTPTPTPTATPTPAPAPTPTPTATPTPTPTPTPTAKPAPSPTASNPCGVTTTPPAWRHVVWILMENKSYSEIIGSSGAPYLNSVARGCGLATDYTAVAHPSLPNYIALTSGSTQGITDDAGPASHPLTVPSIFSQVGANNWRGLDESMPVNCDTADASPYAVRHNPAVYYTNIASQCALQDVPLGTAPDLSAAFTFITPNLCDDMHDCSVSTGDTWLSHELPLVLGSSQYLSGNTAVFITWDEDDTSAGNHVATLVISPSTGVGATSSAAFNHYSLLRSTEAMLGLSPLGNAATAADLRSAFNLG